jgi:hypothetical protein
MRVRFPSIAPKRCIKMKCDRRTAVERSIGSPDTILQSKTVGYVNNINDCGINLYLYKDRKHGSNVNISFEDLDIRKGDVIAIFRSPNSGIASEEDQIDRTSVLFRPF